MRLSCSLVDFQNALRLASKLASHTEPRQRSLALRAEGSKLHVTHQDSGLGCIAISIDAVVEEAGSATCSFEYLYPKIKKIKADRLTISTESKELAFTIGDFILEAPVQEDCVEVFNVPVSSNSMTIPADVFIDLITKASVGCFKSTKKKPWGVEGTDLIKQVYVEAMDDAVLGVGLTANRVVSYSYKRTIDEFISTDDSKKTSYVVPPTIIEVVKSLKKENFKGMTATVTTDLEHASTTVSMGDISITGCILKNFPTQWRGCLLGEYSAHVRINRKEFIAAVEFVTANLSKSKQFYLTALFEEASFKLLSYNREMVMPTLDMADAMHDVAAEIQGVLPNRSIGFVATQLMDGLKLFADDWIILSVPTDITVPMVFKPAVMSEDVELLYFIMQFRESKRSKSTDDTVEIGKEA